MEGTDRSYSDAPRRPKGRTCPPSSSDPDSSPSFFLTEEIFQSLLSSSWEQRKVFVLLADAACLTGVRVKSGASGAAAGVFMTTAARQSVSRRIRSRGTRRRRREQRDVR